MQIIRFAASLALAGASLASSAAELLRDDFSDSASGWQNRAATSDKDLGFAVYTDAGQYQMTPVHDNTFGFVAAPRQAGDGDVEIAADMFLYAGIGAGAGGLACRYRDARNFYGFVARGDAVLLIVKVKDGAVTPLARGKVDSVVAGTVDTRLEVSCSGNTLRLKARGGGSLQAEDGDFSAGSSGLLVVGEKLAGTSAVFDDFELRPAR